MRWSRPTGEPIYLSPTDSTGCIRRRGAGDLNRTLSHVYQVSTRKGGARTNLEKWKHLTLFFSVQQIVVVLHGDERGKFVGDRIACRKCQSKAFYRSVHYSLCIA